ncbi:MULTISPECIES: glycerophosphodiester phosphodiesterase family protein [Shewanella]|jgi:glycerophosphoryl diester phosphodiesterase|uniref:glycerophosphodiester phosphodiesterase n=2 Tax=Shewanella TaxID=22 RepID=A0A9X3B2P9_9GAMM|nr:MULTISPECIES: glycerophosphodiester phosphodiesterase family protein [Shewanella]AVT48334.1 glycerophosphodiester phosphodiesterase [Shewanella baltica]EHQ13663.1 glycerophosphoryl diester phosphodiesterase [Shewanella baltica OS183]KZK71432.1 glycerophosphodiester phosphodiesterase [Shewanella baltica]MCS6094573.1 glycerophosphodiester phosphodiesterase [Shewanella baltica]MCS6181359.1 glycerophosphodiester phosphodiesterase [Shewanella baltica]
MKLRPISSLSLGLLIATSALLAGCNSDDNNTEVTPPASKPVPAQVGERPLFLVRQMQDSTLKTRLEQCTTDNFYRSEFSIGHRGAPMQFPEHTKESYQAAIDSGAGIVECDVTFTADKALVCRHSQCDLASTTNILAVPELANKCSSPFTPADAANGVSASATCCTSDITLAEFKTLKGKMEGSNPKATTAAEFINGTPSWRTDLYAGNGTLMTHAESIEMFKKAGVKMTPELKAASVSMPFDGFTQQDYAQKMLDEYTAAGVDASQVFPQSFILDDIKYWVANAPEFAKQAVFLDDRYDYNSAFDPQNSATWSPSMADLKTQGVEIIAPPLWVLVALDADKKIIPSEYAKAAKGAGLKIITWSLERSGLLKNGGGFYYQSITEAIDNEGDTFELLDVLAKDVGVIGVFSDWPATVTYYANCMDL